MSKIEEIFHVVNLKDDKAKILAMELANDKGRQVLEKIFEGKKSSSEIAKELDMGLPTVLFHVERLLDAGLIKVIDTNLSKKFREIKYYGPSKQAILILPPSLEQEDMSVPLLSRATGKIAGVTSLIGASLSAVLLNVFSKEVPVSTDRVLTLPPEQDNVFEVTKIPIEPVEEFVKTLPPLGTTLVIILVSAAIAIAAVMGIKWILSRKRNAYAPEQNTIEG
jgi:DNA-binding Lrp family transcriptional regulator